MVVGTIEESRRVRRNNKYVYMGVVNIRGRGVGTGRKGGTPGGAKIKFKAPVDMSQMLFPGNRIKLKDTGKEYFEVVK